MITITLEEVFAWDPTPAVFVKGAQCPAHCGGEAATAPCVVADYSWSEKTVSCVLPPGAAGSNMDVAVVVGDKQAEYIGLAFGGCDQGAATNPSTGTCAACIAGTYSAPGDDECTTCQAGTYSLPGASSCLHCQEGQTSLSSRAGCMNCRAGTYAISGAAECSPCPLGTFSMPGSSKCKPCPATAGVSCPGGVLTPQDNWWSPAVLSPEDASSAAFEEDTLLYLCLGSMCYANVSDAGVHTPLTAFRCANAHEARSRFCRTLNHYFRLNALHCTAMAWILILAQCSAIF